MTTQRPTEPRIEPVTDATGELAEILAGALTHEGRPLNIFGVLGRHPKLLKRFNLLGGFLLNKGELPAREREIVILRVGWNAQAIYEFGQHTIVGRRSGLSDIEIAALTQPPEDHSWSDEDRALVALADELHADDCVGDDTWAALSTSWSDAQLAELLIVAGFYRMVSGFLNSAGVQLDPGVPGFPS